MHLSPQPAKSVCRNPLTTGAAAIPSIQLTFRGSEKRTSSLSEYLLTSFLKQKLAFPPWAEVRLVSVSDTYSTTPRPCICGSASMQDKTRQGLRMVGQTQIWPYTCTDVHAPLPVHLHPSQMHGLVHLQGFVNAGLPVHLHAIMASRFQIISLQKRLF